MSALLDIEQSVLYLYFMSKPRRIKYTHNRLCRESFADDASYVTYIKELDRLENKLQKTCTAVGRAEREGACNVVKVKAVVSKLKKMLQKKVSENESLSAQLSQTRDELRELEENLKAFINALLDSLNVNSQNSNMPPSADSHFHKTHPVTLLDQNGLGKYKPKPSENKTTSDEFPTGDVTEEATASQGEAENSDGPSTSADDEISLPEKKKPGKAHHPGASQKLIQPTKPPIECHPDVCPHCGCQEFEDESVSRIQQFIDTARNLVDVLHFAVYQGTCANCGAKVVGKIPKGFEQRYGPGFHTLLAWLNSEGGVTRRHLQTFVLDFLGIPISQGGIQKVLQRVSDAIVPHYDMIAKGSREYWYNHMDETSSPTFGPAGKHIHWMWVMCNKSFSFFKIDEHRSKEAFFSVIGPWRGVLISDDYGTCVKWENGRQTCLAHLIRAAKGVSESCEPRLAECGKWIYETIATLCELKGKEVTSEDVKKIKKDFFATAEQYKGIGGKASILLERLKAEFDAVVYFLSYPVEPTNNFAEQTLRPYVVARKNSFGTTSECGERWLERSLSLRMTCKLRDARYSQVLQEAVTEHLAGRKADASWLDSCVYRAS